MELRALKLDKTRDVLPLKFIDNERCNKTILVDKTQKKPPCATGDTRHPMWYKRKPFNYKRRLLVGGYLFRDPQYWVLDKI